ncbi:MAG: DUF4097 family beta strand repeat-containing protein [Gemmatimonadales bacterium]
MTRTALLTALAAAAAFAAAPTARAQDSDHFNWHGALARGKTLEITGIAGSIRVEAYAGPEVQVSAVKRGPAEDRGEIRFITEPGEGGMTICAVYGDQESCHHGRSHSHVRDNEASVEFVARVPAGVAFDGSMVSGNVEVAGLTARVEVNSVSGDVAVRNVHGDVSAHSVSGRATLEGVDGQGVDANTVSGDVEFGGPVHQGGRYAFRSVSGELTLHVDGALNARVSVRTVSGEIDSDFPVTLAGGGRFGRRNLDFTVGTGDARLELSTVSGDFHLKRAGAAGR